MITNIQAGNQQGLSLSSGTKITVGDVLGDLVVIAVNSVATESCSEDNVLLVEMSVIKKVGFA